MHFSGKSVRVVVLTLTPFSKIQSYLYSATNPVEHDFYVAVLEEL